GTKLEASLLESTRSLVLNRLPNLCFMRDRLLFLDLQLRFAKRQKWSHQKFNFEIAYHLNFYYLLIYGGLDHLAVVVNDVLGLGLPEKQVGITFKRFLNKVLATVPASHVLFTSSAPIDFIKRIGAVRHFAAHRGSIMPTEVYIKPDVEPTDAELDEQLRVLGRDYVLQYFREGKPRHAMRQTLRTTL